MQLRPAFRSPTGSYLATETVYRNHATGADIPTPFNAIPLENSDAAKMSEFYGTARQSRVAILAQGKLPNMTLSGYHELDWLGTGVASNNNQSNSYVMRQLWAQAALKNGWTLPAVRCGPWPWNTKRVLGQPTRSLPRP